MDTLHTGSKLHTLYQVVASHLKYILSICCPSVIMKNEILDMFNLLILLNVIGCVQYILHIVNNKYLLIFFKYTGVFA